MTTQNDQENLFHGNGYDHEAFIKDEIEPLLRQINGLCNERGIPFIGVVSASHQNNGQDGDSYNTHISACLDVTNHTPLSMRVAFAVLRDNQLAESIGRVLTMMSAAYMDASSEDQDDSPIN